MRSPLQRGCIHSQQGVSYINGRSLMVFIKNNIGLSCDSFCIVYFIYFPKDRSDV